MLATIVACLFILGGVTWSVVVCLASGMAARPVDTWSEVIKPATYGLLPVALGLSMLLWG